MLWLFEQLWPNLLSEALGITATVLIIDRLLQRREQKRWAPARLIIARQLARTYATGSSACFQIVAAVIHPSDNPIMTPQKRSTESLRRFATEVQRLHHTIDLNNVALDATIMSDVAEFLEAADELLKSIAFLLRLHVQPDPAIDFICDSPVDIVDRMHIKAERLRALYPASWDNSLVFSSAKTPTELRAAYDSAKYPCLPLFLQPERYEFREGRKPLVPDLEHLRRIKTVDMPMGTVISAASD
jgi:hypothetical protein